MRDGYRGAVVVGRMHWARTDTLRRLVDELDEAQLATVEVVFDNSTMQTMRNRVADTTARMREVLDDGTPIAFLGAGRAAAVGWHAALLGDLDAVMAWNPRARGARHVLGGVAVPSLLATAHAWQMPNARRVARRLGGTTDVARAEFDANLLGGWFEYRLRNGYVPSALRPAPSARRKVAAVSAGLAAGVLTLPLTASGGGLLPDFSAGARLSAADIGGDSHAKSVPGKPDEIKGDGEIVDPPLTDGIGVLWNVNSNVGFVTSSSASGAVSEAGFTNTVSATTTGGGTILDSPGDGVDGYNALCLDPNGLGGQCTTGTMQSYNQNGPASLECSDRQVVYPARTMGPFSVRRKVFVPSNDGFARWVNFVTNTTGATQTARLQTSNNLGSDAGTAIATTSDGDATPEVTDTYVTTFQTFSGPNPTDLRLGHVLRGPNAGIGLAGNTFVNGDDNPFWRYVVDIPAGRTIAIVNFATGQASKAAAATQSAALASLTNPNALNCLTATELGQIVNFSPGSPTDLGLSDANVGEDEVTGSTVGTLSTTDATLPNDSHTYELVSGPGSENNDAFEIVGNELRTKQAFDFETDNEYSVRIRTTDEIGATYDEAITITVTDVAEGSAPTAAVFDMEECTVDGNGASMLIYVADSDTALGDLTVSALAADPTLVTPTLTDLTGGYYRLALATNPANSGTTTVTVTVDDGDTATNLPMNVNVGTAADDIINGSLLTDVSFGRDGADTLRGGADKDLLCGGAGADVLTGGGGNDVLGGGDNNDKLKGGADFDQLYGDAGNDNLRGEGGGDDLFGGAGRDALIGGDGSDNLYGGDDPDRLTGGPGGDAHYGGGGTDTVYGPNPGEGDTADSETP